MIARGHPKRGRSDTAIQRLHIVHKCPDLIELSPFDEDKAALEAQFPGLPDLYGIRFRGGAQKQHIRLRGQRLGQHGIIIGGLHKIDGNIGGDGSAFRLPGFLEYAAPDLAIFISIRHHGASPPPMSPGFFYKGMDVSLHGKGTLEEEFVPGGHDGLSGSVGSNDKFLLLVDGHQGKDRTAVGVVNHFRPFFLHQALGVVDRQGGLKAVIHTDDAHLVFFAPYRGATQGIDLICRQFETPLDVQSELRRPPAQGSTVTNGNDVVVGSADSLARRNQKDHKCRNKKPEPQTYFFHFSPPFVFNKAGVDCLKWDNNISAGLIIVCWVFRINGVVLLIRHCFFTVGLYEE